MNPIYKSKIEKMLSKEFCCTPAQLNGKGTVYTVKSHTEKPYLKIFCVSGYCQWIIREVSH